MTFEEIKQIPDLQVDVTPAVEDAFYFLQSLDKELPDATEEETLEKYEARLASLVDPGLRAGSRLASLPPQERTDAMLEASRMMDNLKKYGVACAAWA